jgi:dihydroorotate dehydrogenase
MSLYESILRPFFFRMDPESAHNRAASLLTAADRLGAYNILESAYTFGDESLHTEIAGLKFPNPVGLAAGFDKDAYMASALPAFGFGFIEVGTITLRPQPGNPLPRLFRFPENQAIINRMGFNSAGAEIAAENLRNLSRRPVPIGINIGLNKDAAKDDAPEQYAKTFVKLYPYGDYFTVNVSSPNTEGLRRLQEKLRLERILRRLKEFNGDKKPIFVKLSPDLDPHELDALLPMLEENASGVICTNTTISRPDVSDEAARTRGGLSGAPLTSLSTEMIRRIYRLTDGRLPIIGAGGIFSAEDAYRKIRAGASLVQVYTGFVYRGPTLPSEINKGLKRLLRGHNLKSIQDAVGKSNHEKAITP